MRSLEVASYIPVYSKLYKKSGSHLTVVAMRDKHTWDLSFSLDYLHCKKTEVLAITQYTHAL